MIDIEQIKQWAVSRWTLGETHGISHWERVERNGLLLATPECDVTVIRLFAYLHDSCRENDGNDDRHGPQAAKMIEGLRDSLLKDLRPSVQTAPRSLSPSHQHPPHRQPHH